MTAYPDMRHFTPVQQNVSFNRHGVLRGIHAEPWDKLIHVAYGEAFAAIIDLRPDQPTFGKHETFLLDGTKSLFVSRGLGNSFQVLSESAAYGYLVNAHWDPTAFYPAVAYDDPDLGIEWPIRDGHEVVSEKDAANPSFRAFREQFGL